MATKNTLNRGFALVTPKSSRSVGRKSSHTTTDKRGRTIKAVRSAVIFYKETVKSPDIRGIMEDLSGL